jgi:hypothetical protein
MGVGPGIVGPGPTGRLAVPAGHRAVQPSMEAYGSAPTTRIER